MKSFPLFLFPLKTNNCNRAVVLQLGLVTLVFPDMPDMFTVSVSRDRVPVNSDRRKFGSCMFGPEKMGIIRTRTVSHDNSDRELGPPVMQTRTACNKTGPCCIKQSANLVLAGMLRARQRRGCVCCIKLSQIASPHARLADLRSSFLGTQ